MSALSLAAHISRQLAGIKHEPDRLRATASILRVIAEALDDCQGHVLDLASDLEGTAHRSENSTAWAEREEDAYRRAFA